ncbi:hypothetical protein RZS08_49815, partial [Arthrospira platensis SPKY1]|nr:hypothetical protein [Arthrospira platensis SPKY1]
MLWRLRTGAQHLQVGDTVLDIGFVVRHETMPVVEGFEVCLGTDADRLWSPQSLQLAQSGLHERVAQTGGTAGRVGDDAA